MSGDIPKDLDRAAKDLDRFTDLIKDLDRAVKDLDRGRTGASSGVVDDVFRRVSGLGGLLVLAFVAPVPASSGPSASNGRGPRGLALSAVARKAEDRENESAELRDENNRKLIAEFIAKLPKK